MRMASCLLTIDISEVRVEYHEKFVLEIASLKDMLHEYADLTKQHMPFGLSTIDWVEQTLQQLMAQTRYCLEQLTQETQQRLINQCIVNE